MEGVHVLVGIDGVEHLVGIDVFGQGQLDQDAVNVGVLVVFLDQGQEGRLGNVGRLIVLNGMKAQFMGGLLLGGDIADGGGIFPHQDGDQAGDDVVFGLQFLHFLL